MRFLYLDNNVLRLYCKQSWSDFEALVDPIFQARILDKSFFFQSSPYIILEAIGIRPKLQDIKIPPRFKSRLDNFQQAEDKESFNNEISETTLYLFNEYKKAFYLSSQLRPKDIYRYYLRTQSTFVTPAGKKLFDSVVTNNLIGKFKTYCTHLYSWYAFERTLTQNYPKTYERDFFAFQMATSKSFFDGKYPNSFSKSFYNVAKDLFQMTLENDRNVILKRIEICRDAKKDGRSEKYLMKKIVKLRKIIKRVKARKRSIKYIIEKAKFGGSRDTVDSEMVHCLVFGSNGLNEPLIAISSDLIEVVACRLSIYKSVIIATGLIGKTKRRELGSQGRFYQYDKATKKLSSSLEVRKVAPFFTYLNQGQDFEALVKSIITPV